MSKELLKDFKTRHQAIVNTLEKIGVLSRSYSAAKLYIRQLNELLLAHFGGQKEEFFKKLSEFYKDEEAQKTIKFLMHDLKGLRVELLAFLEKYTGEMGDRGSPQFPRDLADFSRQVVSRIRIEEEYLFGLLEGLP